MKKLAFAVLATALFISSCKKKEDNMHMGEDHTNLPVAVTTNINYPAAYVVNGESNTILVIRLSDNTVTETIKLGEMSSHDAHSGSMSSGISWPHHIYLNPSKTHLAIGVPGMDLSAGHGGSMMGMAGKIAVVNAMNGTISKIVELPVSNHNAVFSPNGTEIWTTQMMAMGTVLVYDATTYALKKTIDVKMDPAEVTFSSDGTMAFVANGGSDTVTVINVSDKMVMGQVAVGDDPVGAWTGADGNMYVDNEAGKSITVIKVSDMSVVATISLGFMPGFAAYNNAMSELWVTDPDNGKVHWYTKSGTTYTHGGELATGAGAHAIAFSSDEMTAYITNQAASSVSVVDVMNHSESKEITVGTKPNGIVIKN